MIILKATFEFREVRLRNCHNMLALLRGETEGVLDLELSFDEEVVMSYLESRKFIPKFDSGLLSRMLKDAFNRLIAFPINKCALTEENCRCRVD